MRKWTKNDFAYAMDSDVISYGYKKDFQSKEDEKYDLSEVSLLEIIGFLIYGNTGLEEFTGGIQNYIQGVS